MADRYYVETPIASDEVRLVGAEAHHLAHVMRARPGSEVVLFDGGGAEFRARVERVGRSEIELAVISRNAVDRELGAPLCLGLGLPKGDRPRWLVEKAVELGVTSLAPLDCARANDRPTPAAIQRLRRAVIEASKQCGRNRLMEIGEPRGAAEFFAHQPSAAVRIIAQPGATDCQSALDEMLSSGSTLTQVVLAIGPEGGFTPSEIDLASAHGWRQVSLGPRVLRVETAALALAAAVVMRMQNS
jgi:16S rRNA (uracil1498-N3)-methyltransferase